MAVPGMIFGPSDIKEEDQEDCCNGLRAAARPNGSATRAVQPVDCLRVQENAQHQSAAPSDCTASPGKPYSSASSGKPYTSETRLPSNEWNAPPRRESRLNIPVPRMSARISYIAENLDDLGLIDRKPNMQLSRRTSIHTRQTVLLNASAQTYKAKLEEIVEETSGDGHRHRPRTCEILKLAFTYWMGVMQKYSVPLITGVTIAFFWTNLDEPTYHDLIHTSCGQVFGHEVSMQFFVNDIFMCFFFGLAVKEVTEALLPGGAMSPWHRVINPLLATLGGVCGPILMYFLVVRIMWEFNVFDDTDCSESGSASGGHRRLLGSSSGSSSGSSNSSSFSEDTSHGCTLRVLYNGWGVPTATDISLAWMFAVQIFGVGHPAINFMLLLAILDDAIGMVIIAVFYPDPTKPVEPVWLLLVAAAVVAALAMRMCRMSSWVIYIAVCGSMSWIGLLKSHVHPALALVFVVPCMPATHAITAPPHECNLGACDLGPPSPGRSPPSPKESVATGSTPTMPMTEKATNSILGNGIVDDLEVFDHVISDSSSALAEDKGHNGSGDSESSSRTPVTPVESYCSETREPSTGSRHSKTLAFHDHDNGVKKGSSNAVRRLLGIVEEEAPLHVFEASMKAPVDFGMFFFGLANAGVRLDSVGGATGAVFASLLIGKTVGITACSLLAVALGFSLPDGLPIGDLVAMSALAGVGLTVALFLANEAFQAPELKGQAKMGAVLSVSCAIFAFIISRTFGSAKSNLKPEDCEEETVGMTRVSVVKQDAIQILS